MKSWHRFFILGVAALLAYGAAFAQGPRVLKIASPFASQPPDTWIVRFKEGVERRSGGRLRIDTYSAGQLGQIPAMVEGIAMGTVEFGLATTGFFVGLEPRFAVLDAVGEFDDLKHAERSMQDPELRRRISEMGAAKGIEAITIHVAGPMLLASRSKVARINDLKGMKLRVPGSGLLYVEPLQRLGASPVSMSLGEAIPGLQNGTIDGLLGGSTPIVRFKLGDVTKHIVEVPSAYTVTSILANREMLRSLGPELEAIVRQEATRAVEVIPPQMVAELAYIRKELAVQGVQYHTFGNEDKQRYAAESRRTMDMLAARDPVLRSDLEAIRAAAARNRR